MAIHVCGFCGQVCTGDASDEHMCGNEECLSVHLPAPLVLERQARERRKVKP